MELLKSFVLGAVLTGVVSLVVGSQGSSGGFLDIHSMRMADAKIFWSWPLFLAGTGISWGIFWVQK